MTKRICLWTAFLAFFLCILTIASTANAQSDATGLWLTENGRAVINIHSCEKDLCGSVYWITPGGMQTDSKNPDEAQRSRPMCGLFVLSGFERQDDTHWANGSIYKADDGDTYHATLEILPEGKLEVRGYIGIPLLGKSQTWTRVAAKDYPSCQTKPQ